MNDLDLYVIQIRFLHDPSKDTGFVGSALSSNMIRFFKNSDETWSHEASVVSKSSLLPLFFLFF